MSDDISIPRPGPMPARTSFTHSYRARRAGMDDATRRLLYVAGALGLALVGGMGVWSVVGRHSAGVPVIEADSRPVRVKPDNPGGMQVVGANEQIMNDGAGDGADKMGPAAETPDPQALRAQTMQQRAARQPAPEQAASQPAPSQPVLVQASPAQPVPVQPSPGAGTAVSPLPDTPAPATRAMSHPAASVRPAAPGGMMVQLAALDTEAAAKAEWQRLAKRIPDLLGARDPVVQKAEREGKAIWRVRVGGFADTADAASFCSQLRAKGGNCTLATF